MTPPASSQPTKLYYSETLNPQKACAVAKHLNSAVEFVRIDLSKGEHTLAEHLRRNPNGKVPVLEHGDLRIWESVAIMAWLAQQAQSSLWPSTGPEQVEVLRWVSWDAFSFLPKAGTFYFEHHIKSLFDMGPPDEESLAAATPEFHQSASILDTHLANRRFVVGDQLSIADFCLGATLLHAERIHLPIAPYAHIRRWHDRLMELPAWRNPWPTP